MSTSPQKLQIREGATVEDMYVLKKDDLQKKLRKAKVKYDEKDTVPTLQALLAMYNLGLIDPKSNVDEDLLGKITAWCKMTVKEQLQILQEAHLDVMGTKWDHVNTLIRAEFDVGEQIMGELTLGEEKDKKNEDQIQEKKVELNPEAANLLLATVYDEVVRSKDILLLPGSPVKDYKLVLKYIDGIKRFENKEDLQAALELSPTNNENFLAWLFSKHGGDVVPAEGDLHLPFIPKRMRQFVVARPTPALKSRFDTAKTTANGSSIMLYHGTALTNLRSILCNGFYPAEDQRWGLGLFMAEDPNHAYMYCFSRHKSVQWEHSPFSKYAVLLACEVAGEGRRVNENGVHVIRDLSSVMIRYVFLLRGLTASDQLTNLPFQAGKDIHKRMLDASAVIDKM